METMRSTWTDERMGDLAQRIETGFGRADTEIRGLCTEIGDLRTEMNTRFDSMQRTMVTMMGTTVLGFASLLATQL